MTNRYKIVRHYFKDGKRTIVTGLTLDEVQQHCRDPETSSKTATSHKAVKRTKIMGQWFDGYENE